MLSCREKEGPAPAISNYEVINSWIEENMMFYYLWNDRINTKGVDKNESPIQYFNRIIVPEDRYSHIENDFESLLTKWAENKNPGYAYCLYSTDTDDVLGKITCVVKDSPACKSGLTRGMIFTKINGVRLSIDNCQNLTLQMADKHTLTVRDNNSETDYSVPIEELAENPIFLDTVYNINNRKTGYLVYNSFISDNGDFSQQYDMQLNDVFKKFENENINELILDLRYNYRGYIFNSMIMASLIVTNLDILEVYAKYQYNKSIQQIIQSEFGSDYLNLYYANVVNSQVLNNIGHQLDRVFILTSPKTGIMGEILVNGLKLSMTVIVVGNKTEGKNDFSLLLYEDDPEKQKINTWTITPVVMQISNSAGNTDTALTPDVEFTEPLYDSTPLGNINEKVLSVTLNIISGNSNLVPAYPGYEIIRQNICLQQQLPVNHLQSLSVNKIPCK
jgi:C-terminal processing protease CtpA/Prc